MKIQFTLNWKITLASALFLPLLISLGLWQLARAQQKHTILEQWQTQQAQAPIDMANVNDAESVRPLSTQGQFDNSHYWLYEGRFYEGHLGFDVLMPFQNKNGDWLLVNRGWVSATAYRDVLPKFETPNGEVSIIGHLKIPTEFDLLDDVTNQNASWPRYALEIRMQKMAEDYGKPLHYRVFQLAPESRGALAVNPAAPVNMTPERHRAYAFQWFSLAFALCILWYVASTNIVQLIRNKEVSE